MANSRETSEITITTKANVSFTTFNWRIENFDAICPPTCEEFAVMFSPFFTAGEDIGKQSKWFVSIYGKAKEIGCYLFLKSLNSNDDIKVAENNEIESVTCNYKISFGNKDNPHVFTKPESSRKFAVSQNWGWKSFITVAKLHESKATLLVDRTLHICVQIEMVGEPKNIIPCKTNTSVLTLETFSADFHELLKTKKHADVEIVCGRKTFSTHKAILSARSKVFSAMFDSDMKESSTSQVTLSDIDAEIFNAIVEYIYTGKVVLTELDSYTELIYGAEKYDLPELKHYCFSQMLQCVTNETIGMLAVAADAYNADEGTKEAVKVYCQSNISTLWKCPSFKKLLKEHPSAFFQN